MKSLLHLFTIWCSIHVTLSEWITLKYHVGTIGYDSEIITAHTESYYIICDRFCEIVEVKVTLNNGHGRLEGYFGYVRDNKFCEGPFNKLTGQKECGMLQKKFLPNVKIKIRAETRCDNMTLIVRGKELKEITGPQPPIPTAVVTSVGTIESPYGWYHTFTYKVRCDGACKFLEVAVTFKRDGDVDLLGRWPNKEGIQFCEGEDRNTGGFQNCKMRVELGINDAHVLVTGHKRSEDVELFVTGENVLSVDYHAKTHYSKD